MQANRADAARLSEAKLIEAQLTDWPADKAGAVDCDCGLQYLVQRNGLSSELRRSMRAIIDAGFTLRATLPAIDSHLLSDWLGPRHWLIHRSQLADIPNWSGIIGSRLNRSAPDHRDWPAWIESAVRSLARDHKTLLLVPNTSTTACVTALASQANLNRMLVRLAPVSKKRIPSAMNSLGAWLQHALDEISAAEGVAYATLWLSPQRCPTQSPLDELPLQDRTVVALAHRLMALSIRPRGVTWRLLTERLQDVRFPMGTVSVRLPSRNSQTDRDWLDRQATGWYLPTRAALPNLMAAAKLPGDYCRARSVRQPALMQWTAASKLWDDRQSYLTHCVRGSCDRAFRRGECAAVVDAITHGALSATSPYQTLLKIIAEQRLRASGKLLRTGVQAVSFTEVTLGELLARRRYQNHLARWDWEPYGLLIQRAVLEQLGARPVIYGDEALFPQLPPLDQPYFQPALRRSARREQEHWQAEREWRVLDDVRLGQLPWGSVLIFVEFESQAQALAAHSPWPIIWQRANQTQPLPVAARHRRRSSAGTSRN